MHISNKVDLLSITKSLNALLLTGFCLAMFSNVVLAGIVWKAYTQKSRTITPPVISQAFTVSDGEVDAAYLEQMAEYFALLKLNVTPGSVDRQYKQLGHYISETTWHQMQPLLSEEAATIKRQNISSQFTVTNTQVALDKGLVKLTGTLKKHVGKRALEPENVSYVVALSYEEGLLSLLTLKKINKEVK